MSYLLRVLLPDRPGMLGAVATALGAAGADILGVDVVERSAGVAVDDLIVELPPGKLADSLVSAAVSVPGVSVESIQRYYAGCRRGAPGAGAAGRAGGRAGTGAAELLVSGAPRIFRAGWAVVVRYDERGPLVEAASPAAPDLGDVDLPWLPLARAQVLDPTARWVPAGLGRARHRAGGGAAGRPGPGRAGRPPRRYRPGARPSCCAWPTSPASRSPCRSASPPQRSRR